MRADLQEAKKSRSNRYTSSAKPKNAARAVRSTATQRRLYLGKGSRRAAFMLVGEQPGDKEDIAGKPFVGPAGRLLDRALQDAGIARKETFVTNAVEHFKHEIRGKRRLHKRPDSREIERCKIWLDFERNLVKPWIIVALGVTAARSLTGARLRW